MVDNLLYTDELKERDKLAQEICEMQKEELALLENTRNHPEKSQIEELVTFYKKMVEKLEALEKTNQRIKYAKEAGADQIEKMESANVELSNANVLKSGYIKRMRSRVNKLTQKLQKFLDEIDKRAADARLAKKNVLKNGNNYIDMVENANEQEIQFEYLDKAFLIHAKYEFRLTTLYDKYVDFIKYLDEHLNMQRRQNGLNNQKYDINNNITLKRIWDFIEQEKEKILEFEDEMINLSNKSYGIESANKEKWTDMATKNVNTENQKGKDAFSSIFTNAGNNISYQKAAGEIRTNSANLGRG